MLRPCKSVKSFKRFLFELRTSIELLADRKAVVRALREEIKRRPFESFFSCTLFVSSRLTMNMQRTVANQSQLSFFFQPIRSRRKPLVTWFLCIFPRLHPVTYFPALGSAGVDHVKIIVVLLYITTAIKRIF